MKKYYNKNISDEFHFATHKEIEDDIEYFKKYKYLLMDFISVNGSTRERISRKCNYISLEHLQLMAIQKEIIEVHEHIKSLEEIIF